MERLKRMRRLMLPGFSAGNRHVSTPAIAFALPINAHVGESAGEEKAWTPTAPLQPVSLRPRIAKTAFSFLLVPFSLVFLSLRVLERSCASFYSAFVDTTFIVHTHGQPLSGVIPTVASTSTLSAIACD